MTERELLALAADRRLVTSELYENNAYYGHAAVIKAHAGLPPDRPLPAAIEHGFFQDYFAWSSDYQARVPAVFAPAPYRFPVLARSTPKALFAIGPMLLYAKPALDEAALAAEKRRLGRTLLVFPAKSTHRLTAEYDLGELFGITTALTETFDTVRICLYWRDIVLGRAKPFLERGFECVTAGHMFDPQFLPRLRSFIDAADVCMGNEYGTSLLYSVLLDKPFYLHATPVRYSAADQAWVTHDCPDLDPTELHIRETFGVYGETITDEQRALVHERAGLAKFRSPEAMRALIETADDLAADMAAARQDSPSILRVALRYQAQGRLERALRLVEESLEARPGEPALGLFRAVLRRRTGDPAPLAALAPAGGEGLDPSRSALACDLLEAALFALGQGKEAASLPLLGKIRGLGVVLRGLGLLEGAVRRALGDGRGALESLARELEAFPASVEARALLAAWSAER